MTARERVLHALSLASCVDDGWICGLRLADPSIGGLRAAARVHDLRGDGVGIETRPCDCQRCGYRRRAALRAGRRWAPVAAYRLVSRQEAA